MKNIVINTKEFAKTFDKLSREEQLWIIKMIEQLKWNLSVGKPLRFSWFREKKLRGNRLYYLAFDEKKSCFIGCFWTKKTSKTDNSK